MPSALPVNFRFTGQRFHRIENDRPAGQLRDVACRAASTDFRGSMTTVAPGGCPPQWHSPNTTQEAGR
nr:hypothetical protein [Streptomyces sp. NRRL S-1813]